MKRVIISLLTGLIFPCVCFAQHGVGYFLIAHRGGVVDSARAENSLPALEEAARHGFNMVEVDLRVTKDGVLIINHDADLKKYYGVDRRVSDVTWQEISLLRSDRGGSRVLRFEEVLQYCRGKMGVMIDNKIRGYDSALFEKVVALLRKYDLQRSALMIGTDESTDFFTGKVRLSCTRRQLEENRSKPGYKAGNYYLFASDIPKEDVDWARKEGIMVVGAVNEWHYAKSATPEEDAAGDIKKMQDAGVRCFQVDSGYEKFFRNSVTNNTQ
ncbi:MAG TPA: glycerophosphodiester phosphodiesterase family protein [Puia sp.]|nr:glycerophosphodiester phosphodiesterase family protein [Puia sp.]